MDKRLLSTASLAAMSIVIVLALAWPVTYNWPDFVHVKYGFPLTWGVHTLSTIQGPVDIWEVDVSSIVIDLLIWLGLAVLFQIIVQLRTSPRPI
jgi:hypothetical protein